MKKMKDSRTSSIVLHNLLIAVLAFIWLIPIIWLSCFKEKPMLEIVVAFKK